MGNWRLGRLAKTHRWKQVIELLENAADVSDLANATYHAAENSLAAVPNDEGFTRTLTTIFQFVDAFHAKNPDADLRRKGFEIGEGSVFDYIAAFRQKAQREVADLRSRSDVAEIAQDAFTSAVFGSTSPALLSLFGTTKTDVRQALTNDLRGKRFERVMHEFFVGFTNRYLSYHLSRELSNHVGIGKGIANVDAHSEFAKAFELHVRQTVRITDDFVPGWFGKARWEKRLTHEEVAKFSHIAFKKISGEFGRGAQENG